MVAFYRSSDSGRTVNFAGEPEMVRPAAPKNLISPFGEIKFGDLSIPGATSSPPLSERAIGAVIRLACEHGLSGFGGDCGEAAIRTPNA